MTQADGVGIGRSASRELWRRKGELIGRRVGGRGEKELVDDVAQVGDRLAAVDADSQVRAAVEPLRVPTAEGADLVDHPAFAAARLFGGRTGGAWSRVAEALGLVQPLAEQQLHVLQQEP